ncbi:hypothetical protein Leryth_001982 [Lithospermum erythrorhizon]|nr:hypothetical protein Leryth_001982 [Lithospermum erythrorhizon]
MEKYELVKELGYGNFGVAKLLRHKETKELVAMKYLERGIKVILTPTHLVIVMEYAAGGELFDRIKAAGRFSEDEARYFFQQIICGVAFCHSMQICHRDLKLENILLDGNPAGGPLIKICDFGYSKSSVLHSVPNSTVGTPGYMAPEVLSRRSYDGKIADVWSCGVSLYIMLVGAYPFEDPADPLNYKTMVSKIMGIQYKIPEHIHLSQECRDLLSRIFVANCAERITIKEIRSHPWFLKNLPREVTERTQAIYYQRTNEASSLQNANEIMKIVAEARNPAPTISYI